MEEKGKPPSESEIKWAEERFSYWGKAFGLYPILILVDYKNEPPETDKEDSQNTMDVKCLFPYRKADVSIYPCFWEMSERERERAIIHETLHIILWDLEQSRLSADSIYNEALERTVDSLSFCIYDMVNGGAKKNPA